MELLVRCVDVSEASALRVLADDLKSGRSSAVVVLVGGSSDSRHLLCACSKDLSAKHNMRSLLGEINAAYGGNGGGRPDFATGGLQRAPEVGAASAVGAELVRGWLRLWLLMIWACCRRVLPRARRRWSNVRAIASAR